MNRSILLSVAAVAVLGLASGCSKNDQAATGAAASNAVDATGAAASNAVDAGGAAASNAVDATGNAVSGAEASKPVADAQDAAAGPVGLASASTLGSVNTGAFVDNAAQSDMYEIQASKLAEARASTPAIKTFAKQMIKDHTKTTAELKGIVGKGGIDAKLPVKLDNRRQGLIDNLKGETGAAFEARYADQQKASHREALTLLKGYADHGDNADLKGFAAKNAPTVQMHLDMADKLEPATDAAAKS